MTKPLHRPPPKIQDVFHRRHNVGCATIPDVSVQFHTFLLDKDSQEKCVIVTPFVKHECPRLPMGFLNSSSWVQAAMDESFSDMPNVEVCVDGDHIKTVDAVLQQLEQHDFSIKASKCNGCESEAPWSGHIVTSTGILQNPDKIKPILQLQLPKTITEL